ncbi:MAG: putative toxin-antitoxin system toxin component, PIN family [Bacteroidales bacterium]|nr:putative toxin-antitoxin system toxin component, PIN family [Bacteroidales bacterium]MBR6848108.1 putative toxin-antitoxin system toxin component, PIN family [Bacteroidales bacterium]
MERNEIYAVIDTNVLVSALLPSQKVSNPTMVLREVFKGRIILVYNEEILDEYKEVLSREKFHIHQALIETVVNHIKNTGLELERTKSWEGVFPDPKDVVFYEVTLSKDDAYLVTGNIKHFPKKPFVVTPAEMVAILGLK